MRLVVMLIAGLAFARAGAGQDADDYRGGWRTDSGEAHTYEFSIRGARVRGVYCTALSDAGSSPSACSLRSPRQGLSSAQPCWWTGTIDAATLYQHVFNDLLITSWTFCRPDVMATSTNAVVELAPPKGYARSFNRQESEFLPCCVRGCREEHHDE